MTDPVSGPSMMITPQSNRMSLTRALIERSLALLAASAPASTIQETLAPVRPPEPPLRTNARDVPYFEARALRRLAAQARLFAEVLPPEDRRRLLASAARLELDAAHQEAP
jgi:hypothetical protein